MFNIRLTEIPVVITPFATNEPRMLDGVIYVSDIKVIEEELLGGTKFILRND